MIKKNHSEWACTRTAYFVWLAESVCLNKDPYFGQSYWQLATILHDTPFYSNHPMDQNRESDGFRLRETWMDLMTSESEERGYPYDIVPESLSGPCSVLELLVGLATRLEDDVMQNDAYGNRKPIWFWAMIINLSLAQFHDEAFHSQSYSVPTDMLHEHINDILDHWMSREYAANGNGGIFPLYTPSKDQRDVELWLQAREWLNENYPE